MCVCVCVCVCVGGEGGDIGLEQNCTQKSERVWEEQSGVEEEGESVCRRSKMCG